MKSLKVILFLILVLTCNTISQTIYSPGHKLSLTFNLTPEGIPVYQLSLAQKEVIKSSKLGVILKELPSFDNGFTILKIDTSSFDETWSPVWGEVKQIRNNYNELTVTLQQPTVHNRKLLIKFRLFDDGLGFRYEFPDQQELTYFVIDDEITEFNMTGDHKTFWIPGDYDTNEYFYSTSRLSEIDALGRNKSSTEIYLRSFIAPNAVQTPLMMKSNDGLYINISEAALVNYPALNLLVNKNNFSLLSTLVPNAVGSKAFMQAPCTTPWRTVVVSDKAVDILASKMMLNLNEPCKLEDVSWIHPVKYVGIWWEMHVGKSSWNYSDVNNIKLDQTDWKSLKPNGRHGATTENTKKIYRLCRQI